MEHAAEAPPVPGTAARGTVDRPGDRGGPLPEKPEELIRALAVSDVPVLFADPRPYDPQWCDRGRDPIVLDAPRQRAGDLDAWRAALGPEEPEFDLAPVVAAVPARPGGIVRAARAALDLAAFDGRAVRRPSAPRRPAAVRLGPRAARPPYPSRRRLGGSRPARGPLGAATGARPSRPAPRPGARRLAAERGRRARAGRAGAVRRRFRHRQDPVGRGRRRRTRPRPLRRAAPLGRRQVRRRDREEPGAHLPEADRTDAVLLFDEADAVFGKRSEVKTPTTGTPTWRAPICSSAWSPSTASPCSPPTCAPTSTRRSPAASTWWSTSRSRRDQRLALWRHSLTHVPCADDIDPASCARDFELAGGSIRSAVVTAAYAAAERGDGVSTSPTCWRAPGASTARRAGWSGEGAW